MLAETSNLGVISLPEQFSFGVDIRFTQNAAVVILAEKEPEAEEVRQMVARGNRSIGTFEGYLFFVGDSMLDTTIAEKLVKPTGRQFLSGAVNLQMLKLLPKA